MNKLRIISFCFAFLMLIQMLPIVQIGYGLSHYQCAEELPYSTTEDAGKGDFALKNFLPAAGHYLHSDICCNAANIYIHRSEQIPANHSTDVVTPPPDAVA